MKTCELRRRSRLLASSAALGALLSCPAAQAQDHAQDQAAARALFEDGRRQLKKGEYLQACRTLEAASKLYASPGILLNLGDCYEKINRSASAWTEFGEAAAAAARTQRSDQVAEAKRRLAAVEPKLTRLTIRVATTETGLAITRDQTDLGSAAWGEAIPVDPGTHQIHAEAPGYEPWSTSAVVSTPGQTVTVDVPALTVSPKPPAPLLAHETTPAKESRSGTGLTESSPSGTRSHALDWALVGGGVAVGALGGVLWGLGASRSNDNTGAVPSAHFGEADKSYSSAKTMYFAGIACAAVGAAAATVGVVLMTVGRHEAPAAPTVGGLRAAPWVSSGGGGLELAGRF